MHQEAKFNSSFLHYNYLYWRTGASKAHGTGSRVPSKSKSRAKKASLKLITTLCTKASWAFREQAVCSRMKASSPRAPRQRASQLRAEGSRGQLLTVVTHVGELLNLAGGGPVVGVEGEAQQAQDEGLQQAAAQAEEAHGSGRASPRTALSTSASAPTARL